MGKYVVNTSIWTWRSILSLCNKVSTLIFAVFCIISGLSARIVTAKQKNEGAIISGKVLNVADSSAFRNIKIYLGDYLCPDYGIGLPCTFMPFDSVMTDSAGNFETRYPEKWYGLGANMITFAIEPDPSENSLSSKSIILNSDSDTSITLYLKSPWQSKIYRKTSVPSVPSVKSVLGRTVIIKIGDWVSGGRYTAEIINASGKLIASPSISADGVFKWDTKESACGVYFLKIKTNESTLSTQILLND
ncbi:MAG TPA: T9SS type A sorting domain-containing protein [Chitinispirillaceae bacterium]|nr:T9SS type A sorting domain-containing protein [Chitinispirillaceae bacterium]